MYRYVDAIEENVSADRSHYTLRPSYYAEGSCNETFISEWGFITSRKPEPRKEEKKKRQHKKERKKKKKTEYSETVSAFQASREDCAARRSAS